jgi:monoterpene epsilon-lactone hydrolase
MASIRSRFVNLTTRIITRLTFKPGTTPQDFRRMIAGYDRRKAGKVAADVVLEEINEPVEGRWLRNSSGDSGRVILYLHGGAFIIRMPESYAEMVSRLCKGIGASAFMPWYRLAPEHPFPAAAEDSFKAYQYLLKTHAPDQIVVMGDSAGGNLTLSLLNLVKQRGLPFPRAAVALSPITDFAEISSTWLMNKRLDPLFAMKPYALPQLHYLRGKHILDPAASPIYGDLEGLPPLLVVVGGVEALRDDGVGYVRKAVAAGVAAQVHIWQGMPHVHTLTNMLPEQRLAEAEIFHWFESLPASSERNSIDRLWPSAVILFNRRPLSGKLERFTNGQQVLGTLAAAGLAERE